jgi:hypothetical protein
MIAVLTGVHPKWFRCPFALVIIRITTLALGIPTQPPEIPPSARNSS